jgi:hypothetical protein
MRDCGVHGKVNESVSVLNQPITGMSPKKKTCTNWCRSFLNLIKLLLCNYFFLNCTLNGQVGGGVYRIVGNYRYVFGEFSNFSLGSEGDMNFGAFTFFQN